MARLGLALDAAARSRLLAYLGMLERWNRAFNLTAVREAKAMVTRHLLESLAVLPRVRGRRLLDIGTGAGLPGVVLAVAAPRLQCTLLDGNRKKTRFCTQVAIELGLANVVVVNSRVEQFAAAGGFHTVTSRATMDIGALWHVGWPHLAPDGVLLALGAVADSAVLAALEPAPRAVEVLAVAGHGAGDRATVALEAPEAGTRLPARAALS